MVVFYSSKDVAEDIIRAICLAHSLKILWYISRSNLKRIKEGRKVFDLGIGINTGWVINEYRPFRKELRRYVRRSKVFEGLPISLAKRIESFSRDGKYSKIMIGHETMSAMNELYHDYEFDYKGMQKFKGLSQPVPIFELRSCYSFDAEVLARFKDLAWAIKQLQSIKVFDPKNIWLLMILIDIYTNKKDYRKVEIICREAIAVDDTVAKVHVALGVSLAEQNQYVEALLEFDKAISIQSNLWGSYIGKTSCLVFLGKYDECIKTCTYAIDRIPIYLREEFCHSLYYNIAAAYARQGNVKESLANLKRAIKISSRETLASLRKDKDGDFCSLYDNAEFKRIRQGKLKKSKKAKVKNKK